MDLLTSQNYSRSFAHFCYKYTLNSVLLISQYGQSFPTEMQSVRHFGYPLHPFGYHLPHYGPNFSHLSLRLQVIERYIADHEFRLLLQSRLPGFRTVNIDKGS